MPVCFCPRPLLPRRWSPARQRKAISFQRSTGKDYVAAAAAPVPAASPGTDAAAVHGNVIVAGIHAWIQLISDRFRMRRDQHGTSRSLSC